MHVRISSYQENRSKWYSNVTPIRSDHFWSVIHCIQLSATSIVTHSSVIYLQAQRSGLLVWWPKPHQSYRQHRYHYRQHYTNVTSTFDDNVFAAYARRTGANYFWHLHAKHFQFLGILDAAATTPTTPATADTPGASTPLYCRAAHSGRRSWRTTAAHKLNADKVC